MTHDRDHGVADPLLPLPALEERLDFPPGFLSPRLRSPDAPKEDLADALERAVERSEKAIEHRQQQVIEAPKVDASPEPLPDHSGPLHHNTKHRFRRL
jgi:hypothetical protein